MLKNAILHISRSLFNEKQFFGFLATETTFGKLSMRFSAKNWNRNIFLSPGWPGFGLNRWIHLSVQEAPYPWACVKEGF
jgi:hypothetical protein